MASTLVLLRHGESTWNRRTCSPAGTTCRCRPKGEAEAEARAHDRPRPSWVDIVHTSVLTRAVQTANLALATLGQPWLDVRRSWRLNERHYGVLQGRNKQQTAATYGDEQTHVWRRCTTCRPRRSGPTARAPAQRPSLRPSGPGPPSGPPSA